MRKLRKGWWRAIATIPAVVVLALALNACSQVTPESNYSQGDGVYYNDKNLLENKYTLSDGREVTCLALVMQGVGGLSCDWGNAE